VERKASVPWGFEPLIVTYKRDPFVEIKAGGAQLRKIVGKLTHHKFRDPWEPEPATGLIYQVLLKLLET
jgi:hypothetical protein